MIDKGKFETLLKLPESSELDFKRDMFDLSKDDAEYTKSGKIAKDIISFINTIRLNTSYIIFGVESLNDGSKSLIGIKHGFDDSITPLRRICNPAACNNLMPQLHLSFLQDTVISRF